METLIMRPKNQEQLTALKAIAKALKVDFDTKPQAKIPNEITLRSMERTSQGIDLTKTTSHADLIQKLNS